MNGVIFEDSRTIASDHAASSRASVLAVLSCDARGSSRHHRIGTWGNPTAREGSDSATETIPPMGPEGSQVRVKSAVQEAAG